jgi:hypothetical protein
MKYKIYSRLIFACILLCSFINESNAQLISNNVFLKGKHAEVGIGPFGYFGTKIAAPAGYHPRTSDLSTINSLGFVADPDKNGWAVGSPAYLGDYFTPGAPVEGWTVQYNGNNYFSINSNSTSIPFGITGSNVAYYTEGSKLKSIWKGKIGSSLELVQTVTLDTNELFFLVNVNLKNTSSSTLSNVHYLRLIDPDNDRMLDTTIFETFETNNEIQRQKSVTNFQSLVCSRGILYNSYLGLGTINELGSVFIDPSFNLSLSPTSSSLLTSLGSTLTGDMTIGVRFNIGDLDPGECRKIAFTYILKESDFERALTQTKTQVNVAGVNYNKKDTIKSCNLTTYHLSISDNDSMLWTTTNSLATKTSRNTFTINNTSSSFQTLRFIGATLDGCYKDTFDINLSPLPSILTNDTTYRYCRGEASNPLTVRKSLSTDVLVWYTDTTLAALTSAPTPSTATAGTQVYYVRAKNSAGCLSYAKKVTVIVNEIDLPYNGSYCVNGTMQLNVSDTPNSISPWVSSNTSVATISNSGLLTYVSKGTINITFKNNKGCSVTKAITLLESPGIIRDTILNYCQGIPSSTLLNITTTLTDTMYYYSLTGGEVTKIPPTISTVTPMHSKYYVWAVSQDGCRGEEKIMQVNVLPKPDSVKIIPLSMNCADSMVLKVKSKVRQAIDTSEFYKLHYDESTVTPHQSCNCPEGFVGVGYHGKAGTIIDAVGIICRKIDRFGNIISGADTVINHIGGSRGGTLKPPITTIGRDLMTGFLAQSDFLHYGTPSGTIYYPTLTQISGFAHAADSIRLFKNSKSAPTALSTLTSGTVGANPGTITVPDGYVTTGFYGGTSTSFLEALGLYSTPLGAYIYEYNWNDGDTSEYKVVKDSGMYYFTVTNSLGCSATSDTIFYDKKPKVSVPEYVCIYEDSVQLTSDKGGLPPNGGWSISDSSVARVDSTGYLFPKTAGVATVTFKSLAGCETSKSTEVVLRPVITCPSELCLAEPVLFKADVLGDRDTAWRSSDESIAVVDTFGVVYPLTPGTVTISFLSRTGCSVTQEITVNPIPLILSTDSAVCTGNTIKLKGSTPGHSSKPWSSADTTIASIDKTGLLKGKLPGKVMITYQSNKGCTTKYEIEVYDLPKIEGDTLLCVGSTTVLKGSGTKSTDSSWMSLSPSKATVDATGKVTALDSGEVMIRYRNNLGCDQYHTIILKELPTVLGPSELCKGDSITLTGSGIPSSTTPWMSSNPAIATINDTGILHGIKGGEVNAIYYNEFGCAQSKTITVNETPLPKVVSPVSYCHESESVALSATGSNLVWYKEATGGTGSSIAPIPSTLTVGDSMFYVTQTDSVTGCTSERASIKVTVHPLPAAPSVITPIQYCHNAVASALTAVGVNLKWYTVSTGGTGSTTAPVPSTSEAPTSLHYYVTQSDKTTGCESKRSELVVHIVENPIIEITTPSAIGFWICKDRSLQLDVQSSTTKPDIKWYYNGILEALRKKDSTYVTQAGLWSVQVVDHNGCKGGDTVQVKEDKTPYPILTPTSITMCIGSAMPLTVNPGYTHYKYDWYNTGVKVYTDNGYNVHMVSDTGDYYVSVTNETGCMDTTNHTRITYYPEMVKPMILNTDPILSVPAVYGSYQWYRNDKLEAGARKDVYTMRGAGSYYVKVYDKYGCNINSDTIYIEDLPTTNIPTINKGSIKLYPNPSTGMVYIESPTVLLVAVYDMTGKRIIESHATDKVDLSNYADGSYVIHLYDDTQRLISTQQVVKTSYR